MPCVATAETHALSILRVAGGPSQTMRRAAVAVMRRESVHEDAPPYTTCPVSWSSILMGHGAFACSPVPFGSRLGRPASEAPPGLDCAAASGTRSSDCRPCTQPPFTDVLTPSTPIWMYRCRLMEGARPCIVPTRREVTTSAPVAHAAPSAGCSRPAGS